MLKVLGRIRHVSGLAAGILLLAVLPCEASSQANPRIVVAMIEDFTNPDAVALIACDPVGDQKQIIVLKRMATEENLHIALAVLGTIRNRRTCTSQKTFVWVQKAGMVAGKPSLARQGQIKTILTKLRTQPVSQIGNLGVGQWISIDETP